METDQGPVTSARCKFVHGEVHKTADEVLFASNKSAHRPSALEEAKDWLQSQLSKGQKAASKILAQAKADQRPHKDNVLKFVMLMEYTNLCVDFLRTANAALLDKENNNGQAGTKETAREALRKGKNLIALLKSNEARYQGVIPAPGRVNPYMQSVLDQLTRAQ